MFLLPIESPTDAGPQVEPPPLIDHPAEGDKGVRFEKNTVARVEVQIDPAWLCDACKLFRGASQVQDVLKGRGRKHEVKGIVLERDAQRATKHHVGVIGDGCAAETKPPLITR